jgi:integrase
MPHWRRKNASRSWLVSVSLNGQRHLKTLPGSLTKREVAAWEREWRAELERPSARSASTVRAVLDRYWDERACKLANRRTVRAYLGLWGEALGLDTPITQVQTQHVAAILARWRGPIVDATVNRRADALRAAWHYAAEVLGVPVATIAWKVIRLAEPEPPDRSIGRAATDRLLAAWPERSRAMAELLFSTGMRLGAMMRLERRDLDFERGLIHSHTKGRGGGKPIVVPMTAKTREILARMALPDVGLIAAVTERTFRRDRETARAAAGLPRWRAHDARHEFSQRLEDAGLGHFIQDALHHSSPAMRRRYARARVDVTREAIEKVQGPDSEMIHHPSPRIVRPKS